MACKLHAKNIYLDAKLGVLRRAIGRILTLTSKCGVIVLLAWRHSQDRFDGVQWPVFVLDVLRLDATVQHRAQTVDPRYL